MRYQSKRQRTRLWNFLNNGSLFNMSNNEHKGVWILAEQAGEVTEAWSGWADIDVSARIRNWVLLTGIKKLDD